MRTALLYSLCLAITALFSLGLDSRADAQDSPTTRQYWGAETNGVKAGLFFYFAPGSTNQVQVTFVPALNNSLANNGNFARPDHLLLWLPPFESRYEMELKDEAGKPVSKTKKGKALGKSCVYTEPKGVTTRRGPTDRGVMLTPNKPEVLLEKVPNTFFDYTPLSLQDYFKISKSGKYHLSFQLRALFSPMARPWDFRVVSLPPVNADLEVQLPQKDSPVKAFAMVYGVDILGYSFCIAGAVWLLARRLRAALKAWLVKFDGGRGIISEGRQ